jgi:hypothetical protein
MLKLITPLLLVLFFVPVSAQTISLTQQKAADDFVLHNGTYTLYFHRKDMLEALDNIEKKLNEDYDLLKKGIKDGSVKDAEFTEKVPLYSNNIVRVMVSSLGCYLLLQAKATVYKDDKPLKQIVADEAPPEVDLDNTKRNIFFFNEPGLEGWVFHGSLRAELRALIKDSPRTN